MNDAIEGIQSQHLCRLDVGEAIDVDVTGANDTLT